MSSGMIKMTIREIKGSLGRYLAILAIVTLGVGLYSGLKITKPAMILVENTYLREQNFFDFRLLSTIGFTQEDVDAFAGQEEVEYVEGSISVDVFCGIDDESDAVYKLHTLPETINQVVLTAGRMPDQADECVLDSQQFDESVIGSVLTVSDSNEEDTLDLFQNRSYKVVGLVRSPYYMNFERGTTSIGEGRITAFGYVPMDSFDSEYLTEIFLTLKEKHGVYTEEYDNYIESLEDGIENKTGEVVQNRYQGLIDEAQEKIDDAQKELDDKSAEAEEELDKALQDIQDGEKEIADHEQEIADGRKKIADARDTLRRQKSELEDQEAQLTEMENALSMGQIPGAMMQIEAGKEQIRAGREQIAAAEKELDEREKELLDGEEELNQAKEDLEEGRKEYEDARAEFEEEIGDAQQKIDDAREELADIKNPDYYVLNRNTNIGYACFDNDANIVEAVSDIFPVFFFLVAALICMTTMNRMVEEQRTQIGVLKALGYSNAAIMGKFMFYAGSAAAVGAVIGIAGGTWLFPKTIWEGYRIMYDLGEISYLFNGWLAAGSLAAALLCSVGAAFFSCRYELYSAPASLIRPKAPKNGKRIFLERITFIWNRLKFLHKVSVRNIIRYKKRFFMMILGISGCAALLVAGLGIRDSVVNIADRQYDEVQIYDIGITFEEALTQTDMDYMAEQTEGLLAGTAYRYEESVDLDFKGKTKSLYMVIPENTEEMAGFLDLHTEKGEKIAYPGEGEAVITAKAAGSMGIRPGDEVLLRDNDMNGIRVKITGLCENFVYNYIYISGETYQVQTGVSPEYKSAYALAAEGVDIHSAAAKISDLGNVLAVSATVDMRERIGTMMKSMDYIIALIVLCAGCLAFIVLYNLTNINITERIREIATIKVLGFYARETADYVFRENLMLTGLGAAAGLLLGKLLHWFIMYNINIDMISFKNYVSPGSYVWSFLLTFVFAMFVNGFMFFKLEKINMAESLKSIE